MKIYKKHVITFPLGMSDWPTLNTVGLPTAIDLRSEDVLIVNQGTEGSCVPTALVDILEIWEAHNGTPVLLSRNFEYFNARSYLLSDVGVDNGSSPPYAFKAAMQYGICTEATWPYTAETLEATPPAAAYAEALAYKVTSASSINDIKQVKVALAVGFPVFVALDLHTNFMTLRGTFTEQLIQYLPEYDYEPIVGGHAGVLMGYDDINQYFIFRNSWGTSWGNKGYGALPYSIFAGNDVMDCYVVTGYKNYSMPQLWQPQALQ